MGYKLDMTSSHPGSIWQHLGQGLGQGSNKACVVMCQALVFWNSVLDQVSVSSRFISVEIMW
jgi:hypothetical protein